MTQAEWPVPSDHELEALLADTRALLAEKARWEDDQINRDLDVLLHRVRGVKRGSYAQVLRSRAQNWQARSQKNALNGEEPSGLPAPGSLPDNFVGEEAAPDQLAEQLARAEAEISEGSPQSVDENEVAGEGGIEASCPNYE